MDLVAALIQAIEANRDQLNASRVAQGEPGRVEIHVNPRFPNSVRVAVLVEEKRVA